ncbi:differentially expressed in B16F10 1, isoform CRA_a [Mus musculus]|uniref:SS18, nBAF chromatin remodeling complex subunit like 2 n=2 Tax=Murinae TaxID=39107 RepID=A0A1L1SQ78_MOUSE|nr:differentially expressed in B16F10 1, isoform CRA_a [Mus musculus]EDL76826.1 rCG25192, isoform CRA_d [Rattus norvegicus]
MSVIFAPDWLRGKAKLLEENDQLIRCIVEYQNKGRANECVQYQHVLHRNLIYLATIADANTSSLTKAVE